MQNLIDKLVKSLKTNNFNREDAQIIERLLNINGLKKQNMLTHEIIGWTFQFNKEFEMRFMLTLLENEELEMLAFILL